jgi:predicted solute-binding protein
MNVSPNDVSHYVEIIEVTVNHTKDFDDDKLYDYFQNCEYEYVMNAQENFAKVVHKLAPRKYLTDLSNDIMSNPYRYSLKSLFVCGECNT